MKKMQKVQPELTKIKEKFKDDPRKECKRKQWSCLEEQAQTH